MISPEMYQVFDRLEGNRRTYYAKLNNAVAQMTLLLMKLRLASEGGGYVDMCIRDREGAFWIPLTRPGMPDPRPDFPRRDLALMEYLAEWAAGVKYHGTAEIMEMDLRYPDLRMLQGSEFGGAGDPYRPVRSGNWLQRAYKSIFK